MHRRLLIILAVVAVLVVAGAAVGLVESRAQGEPELASITPAQLMANVAQHAGDVNAVSGGLSWKNDLLGLSMLSLGGQGSGDLSALLSGGSGRLWVQGEKARFDIMGMLGDTTIVGDRTHVWVYSYGTNTATEYALPAGDASATGGGATSTSQQPDSSTSTTAAANPVAAIQAFLERLAPDATVSVNGSAMVAGRSCYVLSLVPKAGNTLFGSVQAAIDSETFLPLKLGVYAKGDTKPVLTAGFTSVSYATLADGLFTFTPPANATVEHKSLTLPAGLSGKSGTGQSLPSGPSSPGPGGAADQAPLTLAQAAAQAGFTPLSANTSDPALAFAGAYVLPAETVDLQSLLGQLQGGPFGGEASPAVPSLPSGPVSLGPTVIQRYGQGFGTVVLVEAKIPAELSARLEQMLAGIPLLGKTPVGAATVYQLNTALGSIALWDKDGLLFAAAGSVSQTDFTGFITDVR